MTGVQRVLAVVCASVIFISWQVWMVWPDEYLHIVACDVGQGDATLLLYGQHQILIDGGPDTKVLDCLGHHLPWWDKHLELLVITHEDLDHIGGLPPVMARYHIGQVWYHPTPKQTTAVTDLKTALKDRQTLGTVWIKPILGQQIEFSRGSGPQLQLTLISPREEWWSQSTPSEQHSETLLSDVTIEKSGSKHTSNDLSIVLFLKYEKFTGMLNGDLEAQGESALLNHGMTHQVTLLKVGHHGSKTSTTAPFVAAVRPETSLISCGRENKFGHPAPSVLATLRQFDTEIVRTDEDGMIEVITNGEQYWWQTERGQSIKPRTIQ